MGLFELKKVFLVVSCCLCCKQKPPFFVESARCFSIIGVSGASQVELAFKHPSVFDFCSVHCFVDVVSGCFFYPADVFLRFDVCFWLSMFV